MQLPTKTLVLVLIGVAFTAAAWADNDAIVVPQPRNIFQQALINQIITQFVPLDAQAQINDVAAMFGFKRNDFLVRCLKELQAFEKYAKIDMITAIKKGIKFAEDNITREQEKELEKLEQKAIELAHLLFSNKLQAGELNNIYDLVIKAIRLQINGQTVVDEIPKLIDEILLRHSVDGIVIG